MYANHFVVAIQANGKTFVEQDDQVAIPFGTEYSIYIKNLNNVRAKVNIEIDGESISNGQSIIVPANESVNISRFINGNLDEGNSFKFIRHTDGTLKHRGSKPEDGIIRVEFQKERPLVAPIGMTYDTSPWRGPNYTLITQFVPVDSPYLTNNTVGYSTAVTSNIDGESVRQPMGALTSSVMRGFTAPGSVSNQQFQYCNDFLTDVGSTVVVLRLVGEVCDQPVTQKRLTRTPINCSVCNHTNKSTNKFCSECGASLTLV